MGREFKFPIEYTKSKYTPIHSTTTEELKKYSEMQETILSRSREIFRILIQEHSAIHRETSTLAVLTPSTIAGKNSSTKNGPLCLIGVSTTSENSSSPTLTTFINSLINSNDKLIFIAYADPQTSHRKWKLLQVSFATSFNHNPAAINDGRFLVKFLVCHPNDKQYSAPSQRFWKEYHSVKGQHPSTSTYDLIIPSPNTAAYCEQKNIRAYSQ
jgi:hypothetical protein